MVKIRLFAVAGVLVLAGCTGGGGGPDLVLCACQCSSPGGGLGNITGRVCVDSTDQNAVSAACNRICGAKSNGGAGCIGICGNLDGTVCTYVPGFGGEPAIGSCASRMSTAGGDQGHSEATIMPFPASTVTISSSRASSLAGHPTGEVRATRVGTLFFIADLVAELGAATVMGRQVTETRAFLVTPAVGFIGADNHFEIAGGKFLFNGKINGTLNAFEGQQLTPLSGTYDVSSGFFTLNGAIGDVAGTARADLDLQLQFTGRPPVPVISVNTSDCVAPGVARLHLSSDGTTDPDGANDVVAISWIVDRATPAQKSAAGAEVDVDVSLGPHVIEVVAYDRAAHFGTASSSIDVRDTRGPVLASVVLEPACLWPPNHRLRPYEVGTDLAFTAQDSCNPGGETAKVVSVISSEPADGTGDGHTSPDAFLTARGFCLRSERSGTSAQGRSYTIVVEAIDRLGNRSANQISVVSGVPHDQRGRACDQAEASFVDDGDPSCQPVTAVIGQATVEHPLGQPGGCTSTAGIFPLAAALFVLRRRRIRQ